MLYRLLPDLSFFWQQTNMIFCFSLDLPLVCVLTDLWNGFRFEVFFGQNPSKWLGWDPKNHTFG